MSEKKTRGVTIAGNWKMNHGPSETRKFFQSLDAFSTDSVCVELYVPDVSLTAAKESAQSPIQIGAQNVHWKDNGAFTGEISAPMLKELQISRALVGHSERRQYFGETNETTALRAQHLLESGLKVIFCVGETLEEREANQTEVVLLQQMSVVKDWVKPYLNGMFVIAYEPVWAIGTGKNATPEMAEEAHQVLRKDLWERFGIEASGQTPILYGGSVKPDNIEALLACPNIDGGLIGGASLDPASFSKLVEAGQKALSA